MNWSCRRYFATNEHAKRVSARHRAGNSYSKCQESFPCNSTQYLTSVAEIMDKLQPPNHLKLANSLTFPKRKCLHLISEVMIGQDSGIVIKPPAMCAKPQIDNPHKVVI